MRLFFAGATVRLTCWIAAVVLVSAVVGLTPGTAAAATTVTNYAQLTDAFDAGGDVVLGADITGARQSARRGRRRVRRP